MRKFIFLSNQVVDGNLYGESQVVAFDDDFDTSTLDAEPTDDATIFTVHTPRLGIGE